MLEIATFLVLIRHRAVPVQGCLKSIKPFFVEDFIHGDTVDDGRVEEGSKSMR